MKLTNHLSKILAPAAALSLLLTGCAAEETEVEEIETNLELEDGGYTMDDEPPMFGIDASFDNLGLNDLEVDYSDPMASDAEVVTMNGAPDAIAYNATVLWGMMPPDRTATQPRNWSGAFAVNRGAIVVRKLIRFEGPTDELLPRPDRQVVAFRSATLPHVDGMRLLILDPTPEATEPLTLTYRSAATGFTFSVPVRALLDGPHSAAADDLGNRVAMNAHARPIDVCNHGNIRGRWHKVAQDRGRFIGRVSNAEGDAVGHIRGIYGQRANGEKVFFGKYINSDGQFRGIFRGSYGEGSFRGVWKTRAGEIGALGGEYRETIPGPETGGHFLGAWRELSCNFPAPPTSGS